jgi:hypothetical protein
MAIIIMLPVFYVAVFHVQKFFVQVEMRQELKHKLLVTLQIPADKIQWYKKGKEIIVEGSLFDVKSITYKNGLATVKGLYDKKEKEINKQIEKANNESQNNTLNTTLVKLLGFYFIYNKQLVTVNITAFRINTPQLGCTVSNRLPVHYLSVPTPPPLG